MIRSWALRLLAAGLLAAYLVTAAAAAPARKRAATSGVRKTATAAAPTRAHRDTAATTARRSAAPRRLEDIHIEGEIPAPQVLFVTARDQRRFTRFHHQRYIKSSLQVGEGTPLPTRIALTKQPPTPTPATAP